MVDREPAVMLSRRLRYIGLTVGLGSFRSRWTHTGPGIDHRKWVWWLPPSPIVAAGKAFDGHLRWDEPQDAYGKKGSGNKQSLNGWFYEGMDILHLLQPMEAVPLSSFWTERS